MIRFGTGGDLDLALSGRHLAAQFRGELRKQNARAEGLVRRLYEQDLPGVLLADEVGKGKTYVALGVAFRLLVANSEARVLVITHSRHMAEAWQRKWMELERCASEKWRDRWHRKNWQGQVYSDLDALETDAVAGWPARIGFASYERLKKFRANEGIQAGRLLGALRHVYSVLGLRLRRAERNKLAQEIVPSDLRRARPCTVTKSDAEVILREIDVESRFWRPGSRNRVTDLLDAIQARTRMHNVSFDLLIIDEAHKLEGEARHSVVSMLLTKKFDKCMLVTATPFALSVDQFRRRLQDFQHACNADTDFQRRIAELPLEAFRDAVKSVTDFDRKADLEGKLRALMVREAWDVERERSYVRWAEGARPEAILPTILLEKQIDQLLQQKGRTHIASRRESLCSSWPAAVASLREAPLRGVDGRWTKAFDAVVQGGGAERDPKLAVVVREIEKLMAKNEKIVIFTQRLATSKTLARMVARTRHAQEIAKDLERHAKRLRRHAGKIARWLAVPEANAKLLAKVMGHAHDRPSMTRTAVRRWMRLHGRQLAHGAGEEWRERLVPVIGHGRRLPLIVRYDAETQDEERNLLKFNLPSSPLVLIATPKAQEGIDLHHYCRHVVLFDLAWNPASLEQRIGRVHRLGGIRKKGEKVVVIYCYQTGTYEESMVARVQERCRMMRALLGAGQWLRDEIEIREMDRYVMTFPPDGDRQSAQ